MAKSRLKKLFTKGLHDTIVKRRNELNANKARKDNMALDSFRGDESEDEAGGMSDTRTHSDRDPARNDGALVITDESGLDDLTADQQNTFITDG